MSKVLQFFLNSNTLWLLTELLIASGLCFIPIFWAHALTEQTLSQGLLLATIFLVPSEFYRQFKVEIDTYLAKHGQPVTGKKSSVARITFPHFPSLLTGDLALASRKDTPETQQPHNVTFKLQCWKCNFVFLYACASESLDKSKPIVLNVTKPCPRCHASCQLTVQQDQLHLRQFKTLPAEASSPAS
jgi:hypothetical protein